jgi:hypothetical protein
VLNSVLNTVLNAVLNTVLWQNACSGQVEVFQNEVTSRFKELPCDAALIRGSVEGDRAAWDQLVNRYEKFTYSVTQTLCPGSDKSSVFQRAFIELYQHLEEAPEGRALAEWLVAVVRKLCVPIQKAGKSSGAANREYLLAFSRISLLIEEHEIERGIESLPQDCRNFLDSTGSSDNKDGEYRNRCLQKLRALVRHGVSPLIPASLPPGPPHPADATWIDLVEGRITQEDRSPLELHLVECELCSRQHYEWRSFIALLGRPHLKSAPNDLKSEAIAIFPEQISSQAIPVVRAKKVFDSRETTVEGVRSIQTREGTQHFVFTSNGIDIHLRVAVVNGTKSLMGQILPKSTGGFPGRSRLSLTMNGRELAQTMSTHFGEFHFYNLPEGELTLTSDLPAHHCRVSATLIP